MKKFLVQFVFAAVAANGHADVVTDWNDAALDAIRSSGTPPPKAARALAMTHLAVFDAVNSITLTHNPYLGYQSVAGSSSQEAAASRAAYEVLVNFFPSRQATFETLLSTHLAAVGDVGQRDNGVAIGSAAAAAILSARSADGANAVGSYLPTSPAIPGTWQLTLPGNAAGLLTQWGGVTPFALSSGGQFSPPGAPSITSARYAASYNQVKGLGELHSTIRTQDQTEIAYFWANGGGTSTPPGHWNQITQQISHNQGLSLAENARLFALLNMAGADAGIAAWECKYRDDVWRPITAIRNDDGNPDTEVDPGWEPLLTTPPHPSYVSGHSAFSGAAGAVLREYFGTDNLSFTVLSENTTNLPSGYTRSYGTFTEAVAESGLSRIYGGIHFDFDNVDGIALGDNVGLFVSSSRLIPVPEPGAAVLLLTAALPMLLLRKRRMIG